MTDYYQGKQDAESVLLPKIEHLNKSMKLMGLLCDFVEAADILDRTFDVRSTFCGEEHDKYMMLLDACRVAVLDIRSNTE